MKERYISLREVAEKLGVARGTLDYYFKHLEIEPVKFPLDRRKYILESDLVRIQRLRQEAAERGEPMTDPRSPLVKPDQEAA